MSTQKAVARVYNGSSMPVSITSRARSTKPRAQIMGVVFLKGTEGTFTNLPVSA